MKTALCRFTLLSFAWLFAFQATAQDRLIFTEYKFNDPTLKSMNFDGGDVVDLFNSGNPFPTADWLTVGLALDKASEKIYWTHGSFQSGRIRSADLSGANQQTLVSGLKNPRGLALDLVGGKLYWSDAPPEGNTGGMIKRANLDGTNVETVYLDPNYDPAASKIGRPRVDSTNGWVYFATNDRIVRTNLNGPPFDIYTVVTGVSTARAVEIDTANDHIYWIGADTIEDVVCRADLDNTGYTILHDMSPNSGNSNGLSDITLNKDNGWIFFCDDLRDEIYRIDIGGGNFIAPYGNPGFSPVAMTLDANVVQTLTDCNSNATPDIVDVRDGGSDDCNENGIPDECEDDPCASPSYLLDQSEEVTSPGRAMGGEPDNQSWIIFQPFVVSAGGWDVGSVILHGVTWQYQPEGFTATILPDNGANYPDETTELASADSFFRFGDTWVEMPLTVTLSEGQYWIRLTANAENRYVASVSTVSTGPASFSRSGLNNDFDGPPIALRFMEASAECPFDLDNNGAVGPGDVGVVKNNFGCDISQPDCAALDFDNNGAVGPGDVGAVKNNFGPCP